MNKLLLAAILLLIVSTGFAQTRQETKVATAVEQLRKAMIDADSNMLKKLTTSKLSYGHSSGQIDNQAEFVDKISSGKSDFVTLEFPEQTITINKNIAIVRHKFDAETNDSGKPGEVHLAVLLVWQKQRGNWKLLARQAFKKP